jgi:hypothetical protein
MEKEWGKYVWKKKDLMAQTSQIPIQTRVLILVDVLLYKGHWIGLYLVCKKKVSWPMKWLDLAVWIIFLVILNEPVIKYVIRLLGFWNFLKTNEMLENEIIVFNVQ